MKLALNMIVKASDEEAVVLKRCLTNVAPHVDGIFLTITGKNQACEDVAKMFGATVAHYEWNDNFADARNFALTQIPSEFDYWMWLDCDDVVRNIENLKQTIENHPSVDAFVFNYLYAFDKWNNPVVVHMKTRVLRNDGCVEWRGALHEDFHATRALNSTFVEGIEILHLTDSQRIEDSKQRNVKVALQDAETNPDDPRSFWNSGNALKAAGNNEKAYEALEKFLELTQSEEEEYIIRIRMAEILFDMDKKTESLAMARHALGIRPMYPDAFMFVADILHSMGRLLDAKNHITMALQLEPPYHKIIVFNPRAYDLEPLQKLAQIYMELSLPQLALVSLKACLEITPQDKDLEALIKEISGYADIAEKAVALAKELEEVSDEELEVRLAEVDPEIRQHPSLTLLRNTRIVRKESTGKDVVIFCGATERVWTPDALKEGIGGSEEAVIHLSKRLVERGWNVTVYNNCGHKELEFDGVIYKPHWTWNYRDKQDVTILWRSPMMLDHEINSDKIFVDMHDAIAAGEYNEKRMARVDKVFFKSQAHRTLYPQLKEEKCVIVPNGIVWEDMQGETERDPYLLINTSSPDRGLKTLLDAFEEVKKQVPEAKLKWAYGFGVWDQVHGGNTEKMEWKTDILERMEDLNGVTNLGRIGQHEVAKLYQEANIFAYPTAFYEIDCISARKAQAAGAYPIVTDFAALDETVQHGVKIKTDVEKENWGKPYAFDFSLKEETAVQEWIDAAVDKLKNPPTEEEREEMREWTKAFQWEEITDVWENMIK